MIHAPFSFKLLAMVPQPVKAVILLFPITESIEARRKQEDEKVKTQGQHPVDPTVFYIKQTVSMHEISLPRAISLTAVGGTDRQCMWDHWLTPCARKCTMRPHGHTLPSVTDGPYFDGLGRRNTRSGESAGAVHRPVQRYVLLNSQRATHGPRIPLDLTPEERAKALETTPLFANIHAEAASAGQTTVTEQDMHTDLHFTCFVQAPDPPRGDIESPNPRRLLELDGRRVGPIDRGESTNLLEVRSGLRSTADGG